MPHINKDLILIDTGIDNTVSVKLAIESDVEDFLNGVKVHGISIIESMMSATPYMNLKITDFAGDLITNNPIIPDSIFKLDFGKRRNESITTNFKLSEFKVDILNKTSSDRAFFAMTCITDKWELLFKEARNRSWNQKKYSDVVKIIAEEIGLTPEIEETDGIFNIIQPNWTNVQLLKWITKQAVNSKKIGGYFFTITLDNRLIFKTYDNLFSQKPIKDIVHYNNNIESDDGFNGFTIRSNYMPTLNHGGFGIKHSYFDYSKKEFIEADIDITDISERQLSDWYYIAESHLGKAKFLCGGRDTKTPNIAQNMVLNTSNAVNKIEIHTKGDIEIRIGDIINLIIPTSDSVKKESSVNDIYSGYWLVYKIAHLIDIQNKDFLSHLFLSRAGINGNGLVGLAQTITGKSLT